MLDDTAIDLERANSSRGSPCPAGLVKVRNGQVGGTRRWLIRPREAVDSFDVWNTAVDGITSGIARSQRLTGGPRGARTHDPRIKSPMLYRLS